MRENRTEQPEQLSPPSSFTQWSAAERPGWSLTDQLNTRPRLSPTRILLWSLQETRQSYRQAAAAPCDPGPQWMCVLGRGREWIGTEQHGARMHTSISTLHASNRAVSLKNREGKVFWFLKFTSEIHTLAGVLVCLVQPHRIIQMKPVLPRGGLSVGAQAGPQESWPLTWRRPMR